MLNKKLIKVVLTFVFFSLFANNAFASTAIGTGFVGGIYSGDSDAPGMGLDWAYIEDSTFANATSCEKSGSIFSLKIKDNEHGKRQFTTLLSAQLTGRKVRVSVDDSYKTGIYCNLRWVRIL